MSLQRIDINRTPMQNFILDLEKQYFSKLKDVFFSNAFTEDLLLIEKEIRENYPKFKSTWNLKNKLKIPAERLVRHHIYMQLHDLVTGVYPSPISSDLGILTKDCVICIDVKTIDTVGNSVDIYSTQVEPNQLSFQNTNHPYIRTVSNLESIDHYSRRPVLTYVVKIIYTDNSYSFSLSRNKQPTIVLACIPNGELSSLFDFDIIKNFKTYDYYSEQDKPDLKAHIIPEEYKSEDSRDNYIFNYCVNERGFQPITIQTDKRSKDVYFDAINRVLWWQTSDNKKHAIKAVKSGSTARLNNDVLKNRYDSKNKKWLGYVEATINRKKE